MSYYDLLGVPPEASAEQIRAAYRTLVQLFHPDRLSHLKPESRAFAEERLKALNQAYEVLGDPARRAMYDLANTSRRGPSNPPRPRSPAGPAPPRSSMQSATVGPSPDFGATRRKAVLDRRRRVAQLEAEIAELSRGVSQMETERDRARRQWRRHEARAHWAFWLTTLLTGVGAWGVMLIGIGLFAEPLNMAAQRVDFVLVVALYEYAAALTIALACRAPGTRVGFASTLLVTGRGLLFGWAVGLAGWALWLGAFGGFSSLASLLVLALVVLLAHGVFAWLAVGHMPRVVREQQRQFDHASSPVLQAYQHQLTQLRAQKAVIESETT